MGSFASRRDGWCVFKTILKERSMGAAASVHASYADNTIQVECDNTVQVEEATAQ